MTWLATVRREPRADGRHGHHDGVLFTLRGLPAATLVAVSGTAFPNDGDTEFICRAGVAEIRS